MCVVCVLHLDSINSCTLNECSMKERDTKYVHMRSLILVFVCVYAHGLRYNK